jgi:hypothetical protein
MTQRPKRSRFMGQTYHLSFDQIVTVEGDDCYVSSQFQKSEAHR